MAAIAGVLTMVFLRPRFRQLVTGMGVFAAVAMFVGALQFADSDLLEERVANTRTIDNRLVAMSACLRMWRDHPALERHRAQVYSGRYLAEEFSRSGFAVVVILASVWPAGSTLADVGDTTEKKSDAPSPEAVAAEAKAEEKDKGKEETPESPGKEDKEQEKKET